MATNAAAALLKAALPKAPVASTSNHPNDSQTLSRSQGGQGIRGRASGRGGRGGRSRAGEVRDEDVGMSDGDDAGGKRRGRQGARHSPMGERVSFCCAWGCVRAAGEAAKAGSEGVYRGTRAASYSVVRSSGAWASWLQLELESWTCSAVTARSVPPSSPRLPLSFLNAQSLITRR